MGIFDDDYNNEPDFGGFDKSSYDIYREREREFRDAEYRHDLKRSTDCEDDDEEKNYVPDDIEF